MVAELALEYRQKFQEDVVIDINCYRKHGHNEADDPAFTQPILYQRIKQMPSISSILTDQLVLDGDLDQKQSDEIHQRLRRQMDATLRRSEQSRNQVLLRDRLQFDKFLMILPQLIRLCPKKIWRKWRMR